MAQPISPEEALKQMVFQIPEPIIAAVNQLLIEKVRPNGSYVIIKQKEIETLALQKFREAQIQTTAAEIYKNGWMDFEPIFSKVGWKVSYDKPGYDESYEAYFKFSKRSAS